MEKKKEGGESRNLSGQKATLGPVEGLEKKKTQTNRFGQLDWFEKRRKKKKEEEKLNSNVKLDTQTHEVKGALEKKTQKKTQ